ncbi:hypothetical protein [Streptomyces sp. NBC_01500]|uniref:hypothetical protein n=1 Tax=Streptomyces sp. NBC_01500 TaxID=2903886 RepID=UPI002257256E|nr:hypothetical protein [Streptomyces sp. NBC_01500]MCX4554303.1 hypothetical protein [Streptomyces sp. NBC_01500]
MRTDSNRAVRAALRAVAFRAGPRDASERRRHARVARGLELGSEETWLILVVGSAGPRAPDRTAPRRRG